MLPILYQDQNLIAINKPNGLLVHRTKIAADTNEFALQKLRDQIGQKVYTIHRLDRPTSGILVFALNQKAQKAVQTIFRDRQIQKKYLAIVRGYTPTEALIDNPLKPQKESKNKNIQEAQTQYKRLATVELPIPVSRYPVARYSLVEAEPLTGRMHQIRRHFAHIRHYIVGDKRHGERHHNRMFAEQLQIPIMFLHAHQLVFECPFTQNEININAPLNQQWQQIMHLFNEHEIKWYHHLQLNFYD